MFKWTHEKSICRKIYSESKLKHSIWALSYTIYISMYRLSFEGSLHWLLLVFFKISTLNASLLFFPVSFDRLISFFLYVFRFAFLFYQTVLSFFYFNLSFFFYIVVIDAQRCRTLSRFDCSLVYFLCTFNLTVISSCYW